MIKYRIILSLSLSLLSQLVTIPALYIEIFTNGHMTYMLNVTLISLLLKKKKKQSEVTRCPLKQAMDKID